MEHNNLLSNMSKYHYTFANGKGLWVTSDIHLQHKNIIKYCSRPFQTVDEMDEQIIKNWNEVVKKNDTVFIIGDVGFGNVDKLCEKIKRLNGKKILIVGNHDRDYLANETFTSLFAAIHEQVYIKVGDTNIYINHFPFTCFDGSYGGLSATWQLFGHCHSFPGSLGMDMDRLGHLFPTQYDVGMDNNHYMPVSFERIQEIISEQQQSLNLIRKC